MPRFRPYTHTKTSFWRSDTTHRTALHRKRLPSPLERLDASPPPPCAMLSWLRLAALCVALLALQGACSRAAAAASTRQLPHRALLQDTVTAAAREDTTAAAQPAPPVVPAGALNVVLKTQGRHIVDAATGQRFKLRCASWSGAQEKGYVPNGLDKQPRTLIAAKAREAGLLNCIRLPYSVEMVVGAARGTQPAVVPAGAVSANPDLLGKSPLEVLDAVIEAIAAEGMVVILDNHSSNAIWCCGLQDGNGLWYTDDYTKQQWIDSLSTLARRYAASSAVVGHGLRNEPRPTVVNGAFLIPLWGAGGAAADLAAAYEEAAAAVLAARPTYLVAAQGLMAGRDLQGVRSRPLVLRSAWPDGPEVTGQLVFEAHEYPFLWGGYNFSDTAAYFAALDKSWGYLSVEGTAPVWVGEFGVEHTDEGLDSVWFQAFTRYIRERDLDWAYWPLDGTQGPSRSRGALETYGLLNTTWDGFSHPRLLATLRSLG